MKLLDCFLSNLFVDIERIQYEMYSEFARKHNLEVGFRENSIEIYSQSYVIRRKSGMIFGPR